ncbi:MAG: RHS repeat-associated core domain-containing protein [Lachnospirales bacterium]
MYSALDSSDNSIKTISEVYSYDEGFANPTEISYQVSKGGTSVLQSYNTYCTYDANERIKSVRNAENYLTKYEYDGIGNITEIEYLKNKTDISGNIYDTSLGSDKISIAYNYKTNTITVTNENGKKTVYDYDSVGNKSSVTSKSDGTTGAKDIVLESYTYDTRLRPVEVITGKAKTTYTYDDRDRVLTTKVTDKEDGTLLSDEAYSYVNNSTGLKTTHTLKGDSTAPSIVTVTQQDVLGRTLTEKTGSATTTYTYDMLNNIVKKVGANTETYEYNSNGNVIKTTATTGSNTITTTATYDMIGNMLTSTDGNGNITSYSYTGLNWLSTVETQFDSTGNTKTYCGYDKLGNKISEGVKVTSNTNRTVSYEYDHRNRVVKSAMGSLITNNEYDGVGNIIKVSYGPNKQNAVTYTYDRRNLLTKYIDALGQAETYTYDDYGNMISKKDRNGNTIKYNYDALGRLLNEDTEGINNSFTYNMTGGVKTSVNSNVSQSYTYNNLGLVTNETTGNFSISRIYDTWGRNTQNVYKKGNTTYKIQKYTYDGLSRLLSVSSEGDSTTKFTANYTYDNNSNITKVEDNNCTRTYTYNNANMLTVINNDGSGSLDTKYSYVYNYDGNINKATDTNGRIVRYEYNSSNQLTGERRNESGIEYYTSYYYNIFGNRTDVYSSEDGYDDYYVKYTYDKNNRLLKEKRENYSIDKSNEITDLVNYTITEYSYDNNGNQISKAKYNQNIDNKFTISINDANTDDSTSYEIFTYDRLNELTEYKKSNGTTATYAYLPNHYRMSKTVDGVLTQQIWDGDNIVAEANSSNTILRSYTRGHQLLTDDDRRAYMYDGHGNLVQQNRGTTAENVTRYDAYGNKIEKTGTTNDTPFGYCGEYLDKESGLIYLRNRYYDSESGRFISEDPIKDGVNWYSYCGGNPVMFWDLSGLKGIPIRDTIEKLGGKVTWYSQNNVAKIELDGQTVYAYNNDKYGSYFKLDDNGQKVMYCDDELLFKSLAVVVDLGKGWQGRIERNTSGNNYGKKHIHVYNGKESYSQNEDGSPHDGSKGSPPKSVKKKLKELKGWDWDAKEDEWISKIELSICEYGAYIITYPNGRKVEYYVAVGPATTLPPSKDALRDCYTGSTYIYVNPWDNLGSVYAPTPSPGTFALPAPNPVPVLP